MRIDEEDLLDDLPRIGIDDENDEQGSNGNRTVPSPKTRNGRRRGAGGPGSGRRREYTVVMYVFLFLFLAMVFYFVWFMTRESQSFIANSYNPRMNDISAQVTRGDIETKDGKIVATTVTGSSGTPVRQYPYKNLYSHVAGYTGQGLSGLESKENFTLLESHSAVTKQIKDQMDGTKSKGDTVVMTIDSSLQQAASDALGNASGAVIAMDPETGDILCMVSKPDFDPNTVAEDWDSLTSGEDGNSILLNRATQGLYAPGSTFKIVTALEYLREGNSPEDTYTCTGSYTNDGYTVHCAAGEVHGKENLDSAFYNSCNCTFSQIGLKLSIPEWQDTAKDLLFNTDLPSSLGASKKSSFSLSDDADHALVMATAFGQGKTLVTPAHLMLISSAIANDGILKKPVLVDSIVSADKTVKKETSRRDYKTLMSEEEASELTEMMRDVVTKGTGRKLNTTAYDAYGKTGSAEYETGSKRTHSWFTGFADNGEKKIAISVIVEGSGSGSSFAVPVTKQVFDTYFAE